MNLIMQSNPMVLLARVVDANGNLVVSSEVASMQLNVFDAETLVNTLTDSLTPTSVLYASLQKDSRWTTDAIGYNLAVSIDGSAFPTGNETYQVQITITPTSGSAFNIVRMVKTKVLYQ